MQRINITYSPKLKELQKIFTMEKQEMEWEKIVASSVSEIYEGMGIHEYEEDPMIYLKPARSDERNVFKADVQAKVIERSESHALIQEYMGLNAGFEKRVKDENREVDEKNVNLKRAQKSPKQKDYQKRRGVEGTKR